MEYAWVLLGAAAFGAGFIDAVVGGGGLVQIPGLLAALPKEPVPVLLGTSKLAGIFGTASAAWRYARTVRLPWRLILPAAVAAFVSSLMGAYVLTLVPSEFLKPLVTVMLIVMAIYTFRRKDFGATHRAPALSGRERVLAMAVAALIGFYDGFFGPGTGTFLIFLFVRLFGFDFLHASAAAKVVNVGTNLAAALLLGATGNMLYAIGLGMAVANVAGAQVGSHMAIAKGSAFVRVLFLLVVSALIAKLGWDMWRGV